MALVPERPEKNRGVVSVPRHHFLKLVHKATPELRIRKRFRAFVRPADSGFFFEIDTVSVASVQELLARRIVGGSDEVDVTPSQQLGIHFVKFLRHGPPEGRMHAVPANTTEFDRLAIHHELITRALYGPEANPALDSLGDGSVDCERGFQEVQIGVFRIPALGRGHSNIYVGPL
jgi:hypothetical protein